MNPTDRIDVDMDSGVTKKTIYLIYFLNANKCKPELRAIAGPYKTTAI